MTTQPISSNDIPLLRRDDPRPSQVALLTAILLHGLLLVLTIPSLGRREPPPPRDRMRPFVLTSLPKLEPPPTAQPARARQEDLAERLIPAPDPAPEEPEPLREPAAEVLPIAVAPLGVGVVVPDGAPPARSGPRTPGLDEVSYPELLERVMPAYPEEARRIGKEGRVILRAVIQPDGTIGDLGVVSTPGFGFDEEALQAVRQWRYRPGVQHGRPVSVYITIIVEFELTGSARRR